MKGETESKVEGEIELTELLDSAFRLGRTHSDQIKYSNGNSTLAEELLETKKKNTFGRVFEVFEDSGEVKDVTCHPIFLTDGNYKVVDLKTLLTKAYNIGRLKERNDEALSTILDLDKEFEALLNSHFGRVFRGHFYENI